MLHSQGGPAQPHSPAGLWGPQNGLTARQAPLSVRNSRTPQSLGAKKLCLEEWLLVTWVASPRREPGEE